MLSLRLAAIVASLSKDEKRALLGELQGSLAGSAPEPAAQTSARTPTSAEPFGGMDLVWLLDQLPSMVAYWDLNQRCRYANAAYEDWLGVSRAKMANITLELLLGPLYALNQPFIEGALRGKPQQFERTIRDPRGGRDRHSLTHYIPDVQGGVVKGFVVLVNDVTDLHQLREEMQERAAEMASLVDLLPVGVSTLDTAGNVLTMNQALEAILGLARPSITRGDFPARTYIHADGRLMAPGEHPSALAIKEQRPVGPTEIGFTKEDGAMVWVTASAVPLSSRRSACIVVTRDITKERALQSSLENSNKRFAAISEATPVPLALNDEHGNITYLNAAFTAQFGYTIADIPTLEAWWPRAYPNVAYRQRVAADWSTRLERAEREGRLFEPMELEVVAKNGANRIVIASAAPLSGGFEGEHLVVLFDITDKTRAEAFLRSVVSSTLDAIITIDEEQRIVTFNVGAERMFRCAADAAIGGPLDRFIPEGARKRHAADVRAFGEQGGAARAMAASTGFPSLERKRAILGLRADGQAFPLAASISQVTIGGRRYFTAICRDTTELQRAENVREQLEAQLRQFQKKEAIDNFAAGIAHDFNNILTAIMGLAEVTLADNATNSALKEDLSAILQAGKRGAALAHQLVTFSRPATVDLRPVVLRGVVQEVTKLLRSALPPNIEIEESFASDLQPVLADAGQVHQVLLNLCGNGVHAMRERAGRLSVSLKPWHGSPTPGQPEGDFVRMSVRDEGHGIAPELLPRIFDPFFTTKKVGEGSGMGLAIVRALVEAHSAAITVESEVGVYTTFHVFWPTIAGPRDTEGPRIGPGQRATHVLFVDDDATLCSIGERSLRSRGYRVTTFTDPEAAWKAFSGSPTAFDVVLTDLTMPNLTGLELAKKMLAVRKDVPIIVCTGNPGALTAETAEAAGIRELVLKPMGMKDLLDVVARATLPTSASHSARG